MPKSGEGPKIGPSRSPRRCPKPSLEEKQRESSGNAKWHSASGKGRSQSVVHQPSSPFTITSTDGFTDEATHSHDGSDTFLPRPRLRRAGRRLAPLHIPTHHRCPYSRYGRQPQRRQAPAGHHRPRQLGQAGQGKDLTRKAQASVCSPTEALRF